MTCNEHPYALVPVLCQSVVDRIDPEVERLQDKVYVFGEAYARKRTLLYHEEENMHGVPGGGTYVEFYIVSKLKEKFDFNMVVPVGVV